MEKSRGNTAKVPASMNRGRLVMAPAAGGVAVTALPQQEWQFVGPRTGHETVDRLLTAA